MIRVLIVDDYELIRCGVKMKLSDAPEISVIGEAKNGREALEMCQAENPDVVIMDIRMPVMDGIEATRLIKEYNKSIKVLMHTSYDEQKNIENAKESHCNGFIIKGEKLEDYVSAIKSVYCGFDLWSSDLQYLGDSVPELKEIYGSELEQLKPIEKNIIGCKVRCLSYTEMAEELNYSETYLRQVAVQLKDKLGLRSVQELAVWGARRGL